MSERLGVVLLPSPRDAAERAPHAVEIEPSDDDAVVITGMPDIAAVYAIQSPSLNGRLLICVAEALDEHAMT
jgi:hypothetical protein